MLDIITYRQEYGPVVALVVKVASGSSGYKW